MNIEPFSFERNVIEYITEKYKLNDNFYLEVKYIDGKVTQQKIHSFRKIANSNFVYIDNLNEFKEKCRKNYYYSEAETKTKCYWWMKHIIDDPLQELKAGNFDEDRILNIRSYDHSILDRNGNYLDILFRLDYTRGRLRQTVNGDDLSYIKKYSWNKLKKHLKNHPQVLNLQEIEVPYFNRDFEGQKALEMDVLLLGEWRPKDSGNQKYKSREDIILDGDHLQIKQFIIE